MNNLLVYLITCWLCNIQETTVKSCTVEWSLLLAPLQTCCQMICPLNSPYIALHFEGIVSQQQESYTSSRGSRLYHLQTDITWPLASLFTCHCRCCRSRAQCMNCKILPLLRNWSLKTECDGWFYIQHNSTFIVWSWSWAGMVRNHWLALAQHHSVIVGGWMNFLETAFTDKWHTG